jgi:hypothetical protein
MREKIMTEEKTSLREAIAARPERTRSEAAPSSNEPEIEAVAVESAECYKRVVADINRAGESEMDRALLRS